MKKAASSSPKVSSEELRSEYRFTYSKSKPNRFASKFQEGSVAVVLDPDVASVFHSSEAVNALLRSVIAALPSKASPSKARSGAASRKAV
jgi:hypothetical protein